MEIIPLPDNYAETILPQLRRVLSWFMSDDEVELYSNLAYSLTLVRQRELCWQAIVSVGLHYHFFDVFRDERIAHWELDQDMVAPALESCETLLAFLNAKLDCEPLTDEEARVLFHVRWALGFVYWAANDTARAIPLWEITVEKKLSMIFLGGGGIGSFEGRHGEEIIPWEKDSAAAMAFTAFMLSYNYELTGAYYQALTMIKIAAGSSPGHVFLHRAFQLLDAWAKQCEEDEHKLDDQRNVEWIELFASVGDILRFADGDESGVLPHECKQDSAQFLAWNFGRVVGAYATVDRFRTDLRAGLADLDDYADYLANEAEERVGEAAVVFAAVLALVSEYGPERDWVKLRELYIDGWWRSAAFAGCPVHEIGPNTDLYWAMRIGFADKVLEVMKSWDSTALVPAGPIVPQDNPVTNVMQQLQRIEDITSSTSLRQVKQWQELDKRLPPERRKLYEGLAQGFGSIWDELPKKVANALAKAERYYRTEVNDDDAKVWFAKAVEAALDDCLVSPLIAYMEERHLKQMTVPFPAPRGPQNLSPSAVRKLTLGEWAGVLAGLGHQRKDLSSLATKELKEFLNNVLFAGKRWPDLFPLAQGLRRVQEYRGGSAHYQEAATRMEKEEWELEELRNLVLGIGQQSVIELIYRLLGKKNL